MIIPPCCVSCGNSLFDKWHKYQELVLKYSSEDPTGSIAGPSGSFVVMKPDKKMLVEKTPQAKALEELGLNTSSSICCARMLLSHIDIVDDIY